MSAWGLGPLQLQLHFTTVKWLCKGDSSLGGKFERNATKCRQNPGDSHKGNWAAQRAKKESRNESGSLLH